jgi:hypothetical protein
MSFSEDMSFVNVTVVPVVEVNLSNRPLVKFAFGGSPM